jgi:hypothetical protein
MDTAELPDPVGLVCEEAFELDWGDTSPVESPTAPEQPTKKSTAQLEAESLVSFMFL